jgi:Raf kinase inhibitor-like YbhB/YbcL family protein
MKNLSNIRVRTTCGARTAVVWVAALVTLAGCTEEPGTDADSPAPPPNAAATEQTPRLRFIVTSPSFENGGEIPRRHTADGEVEQNISPEITWQEIPGDTDSLALICDDPDAPSGDWVHWVIYNIPVDAGGLYEGIAPVARPDLPPGALQGRNSWPDDNIGYRGPAPPPGPPHRYRFRVYALDTTLELPPEDATKQSVLTAMDGHVSATGELIGVYGRESD